MLTGAGNSVAKDSLKLSNAIESLSKSFISSADTKKRMEILKDSPQQVSSQTPWASGR